MNARTPRHLMAGLLSASVLVVLALLWPQILQAQATPTAMQSSGQPSQPTGGLATGGLLSKLEGPVRDAATVDQVNIRLISEQQALVAGQRQWFGLVLNHEPGWHTYWRNPGDSGLATTAIWRLQDEPGGVVVEPRLISQAWPTPSRLAVGPLANYGYENQVVLGFELEMPKGLTGSRRLVAEISWLVCKDVCIPGEAKLAIELPAVTSAHQAPPGKDAPLFAEMRGRLPVEADWGQGVAIDTQANALVLWGQGDWQSRQGLWFVELEELINPASGQSWFVQPQGWLVKIPLSERPKRAIAALEKSGRLHAVLKPKLADATTASGTPGRVGALGPAGFRTSFRLGAAAPVLGQAKPVWQSPMASEEPHGDSVGSGSSAAGSSLWVVLGLAFLGGMVLNLMPCVFPVLGLKVLAFSQQAHSPGQAWRHAAFFTAGVLVSMVALAGLLLGLRAAGEAVGWGFQLQNPWVVLSLAILFTGIGLNLLGVFEVGARLTQLGALDRGHGPWAAFGSGVLVVVVASPCTAPFMGSAVGYTATAPAAQTLLVFGVLGLGLAAPYGLAAVWPGFLTRLPKPGPWMVTFKQFLAFPMLATVAWLVWVLTQQQGLTALMPVLLALVLLSFAAWCWGGLQTGRSGLGQWGRWLGIGLALLVAGWLLRPVGDSSSATSGGPRAQANGSAAKGSAAIPWQAWSSGRPEQLAAQGKVVFVDFTAAWCITCQANKVRVLQTSPVVERLNAPAVVPLVADWTKQDPAITKELQRYGRNGVPLYLVYGPKLAKPVVLGEWLSTDAVMTALSEAGLPN
jgi:thiol:disulfide interchange protein/DsbC/DsbD-like thiol-disulfide interchange protein